MITMSDTSRRTFLQSVGLVGAGAAAAVSAPRAAAAATSNEPCYIGAYHHNRVVEQGFDGWLGDVRIADRALPPAAFMTV